MNRVVNHVVQGFKFINLRFHQLVDGLTTLKTLTTKVDQGHMILVWSQFGLLVGKS